MFFVQLVNVRHTYKNHIFYYQNQFWYCSIRGSMKNSNMVLDFIFDSVSVTKTIKSYLLKLWIIGLLFSRILRFRQVYYFPLIFVKIKVSWQNFSSIILEWKVLQMLKILSKSTMMIVALHSWNPIENIRKQITMEMIVF